MVIVERACAECGGLIRMELRTERAAAMARDVAGLLCENCGDLHKRQREDDDRKQDALRYLEARRRRVQASGVPKALLEQAAPREAILALQPWAEGQGPPLAVVWGDVGRGKTVAAARAFGHLLGRRKGFWRQASALARQLRGEFGSREREEAEWIAAGRTALALDDISAIGPKQQDAQEQIAMVIDAHYAARVPLIVTSNLHPERIEDRWPEHGRRVASRLSSGLVLHVGGPDWRRAGRMADGAPPPQQEGWAA